MSERTNEAPLPAEKIATAFSPEVIEAVARMNEGEKSPEQYLRDHLALLVAMRGRHTATATWAYQCIEDLLLQEGKAYTPQPLPAKYVYGEMKQCFSNSFFGAISTLTLRYVEGYGLTETGIPMAHAWLIDQDDRVIDTTWRWQKHDPDGHYYIGHGALLGLVIPPKLLTRVWTRREYAGVLDDYEHGYPALQWPWEQTGTTLIQHYNDLPVRKSGRQSRQRSKA